MRQQRRSRKKQGVLEGGKCLRACGGVSVGVIGLLGIAMVCPMACVGTNALDNTTRSVGATLSVDAAAAIGLSLGAAVVEIDVTPNTSGVFKSEQTDLAIITNNPEGYSFYLKTADGKSTLNSARADEDTYSIQSIADEVKGAEFAGNVWGVAVTKGEVSASTTFSPVPTTSEVPFLTVEKATGEVADNYKLGFGVKVDTSLPSGRYTNHVIASVIANPAEITTLSDLVFMQDMTEGICASTPSAYDAKTKQVDRSSKYYLEPVEKKLTDLRDGKQYYVAKLADGNCWMTQNLDYDLVAGRTLTPGDTDVLNDWLVPTSTTEGVPAKTAADYTSAESWDLGEVVLTNPTGSSNCNTPLPDELKALGYTSSDNYNSVWYGQKITETCSQWYKDVSSMEEGYDATETSSVSGNKYDGHYLIGNYYQWNAVTAGTGSATNEENLANGNAGFSDMSKLVDAKGSICPKGWKLPTSGTYVESSNGVFSGATVTAAWPYDREDSFYRLLEAYGYPKTGSNGTNSSNSWLVNNGNPYTAITGTNGEGVTKTRLDSKPLAFVRSGYTSPSIGSLRFAGHLGSYWVSSTYPASSAYTRDLGFDIANINPSSYNLRYNALSARCVAR